MANPANKTRLHYRCKNCGENIHTDSAISTMQVLSSQVEAESFHKCKDGKRGLAKLFAIEDLEEK